MYSSSEHREVRQKQHACFVRGLHYMEYLTEYIDMHYEEVMKHSHLDTTPIIGGFLRFPPIIDPSTYFIPMKEPVDLKDLCVFGTLHGVYRSTFQNPLLQEWELHFVCCSGGGTLTLRRPATGSCVML